MTMLTEMRVFVFIFEHRERQGDVERVKKIEIIVDTPIEVLETFHN